MSLNRIMNSFNWLSSSSHMILNTGLQLATTVDQKKKEKEMEVKNIEIGVLLVAHFDYLIRCHNPLFTIKI